MASIDMDSVKVLFVRDEYLMVYALRSFTV